MSGNGLNTIDDSIGKLPNIKEIDFSGNQLTTLNPKIAEVRKQLFNKE